MQGFVYVLLLGLYVSYLREATLTSTCHYELSEPELFYVPKPIWQNGISSATGVCFVSDIIIPYVFHQQVVPAKAMEAVCVHVLRQMFVLLQFIASH